MFAPWIVFMMDPRCEPESESTKPKRDVMAVYAIREMTLEDYEKAYDLWAKTEGVGLGRSDTREEIGKFLERNPGHSFVCLFNDDIVGTVLCGHDGRRGFLYHVAVSKQHRSQGLGKKLVDAALDRLRSAGIHKCHLMVYAGNEAGQRFWEKTAWERREDILIYSKNT